MPGRRPVPRQTQTSACARLDRITLTITLPYNRLRWPNPCAQKAFPLPLYPCPEIKTILGRTLVFHFTFPIFRGPFWRGLPPVRATAFDILKLAGSSIKLPGPLPGRFQKRTIFFER